MVYRTLVGRRDHTHFTTKKLFLLTARHWAIQISSRWVEKNNKIERTCPAHSEKNLFFVSLTIHGETILGILREESKYFN